MPLASISNGKNPHYRSALARPIESVIVDSRLLIGRHVQVRNLQTWADQVHAEMNQDEVVRDVAGVTDRLKRHQELKAEIDAREDTFTNVADSGQAMIKAGHFAANDVCRLFSR